MGSMHCNPNYDSSEASPVKFRNLVHISRHRKVGVAETLTGLSQRSEACKPTVSLEVCKFPLVYRFAIKEHYEVFFFPSIYVVTL